MLAQWKGFAGVALVGALAGLFLGWQLWKPRAVVETPAVEVRNKDSSLTLERKPDATAAPTHVRPPGVVERIVRVTVKGDPFPVTDTLYLPAHAPEPVDSVPRETIHERLVEPPALEIELSLVRLGDGSRRVTASVTGGRVIGGVDIPVEAAMPPPRAIRWSAGPTYSPTSKSYGGALTRDLGPLRVLGALDFPAPTTPLTARVGVLIRF